MSNTCAHNNDDSIPVCSGGVGLVVKALATEIEEVFLYKLYGSCVKLRGCGFDSCPFEI